MNTLKRLWQKSAPGFLLNLVRFLLEPEDYRKRRRAVLNHYSHIDPDTLPASIREGISFLKHHKYTPFPFKWALPYENLLTDVLHDEVNRCSYVIFKGKKMYFPPSFSDSEVAWAVRAAMREQDPLSPHLYLTGDFFPWENSVIIDAGVAEGNFALSVVEKARRLYLVECDPGWMGALKLTFEPWKDKVVFVEKYMSDKAGDSETSIDDLLRSEYGNDVFIKLDIEGYEKKALAGMKDLLASGSRIRMDICTYHYPGDFQAIKEVLGSCGFSCQESDGFVLFFHEGEEPSFRKVLIRAERVPL